MSFEKEYGTPLNLEAGRRAFLRHAGLLTAAAALGTAGSSTTASAQEAAAAGDLDLEILNFALNLEYLEAEYYLRGVTGKGLPEGQIDGRTGPPGKVIGGHEVPFKTTTLRKFFEEIAEDESNHVRFLRSALGDRRVARPDIDLKGSFTAAAQAAGLVGPGEEFDPFATEDGFLLGAFVFEDVGVTAYLGAAPLITSKAYLGAAAAILAVEAYHAGEIRTNCYLRGLFKETAALSNLRDHADGGRKLDQPIRISGKANIVPANSDSLAFARTTDEVLRVVYLGKKNKGGFFPHGTNGAIT